MVFDSLTDNRVKTHRRATVSPAATSPGPRGGRLWGNVAAHMWASQYGIAFVEDRVGLGLNYNVTIEVGAMLMAGRRCAILKDPSAPALPTDLIGHIYTSVDFDDSPSVSDAIHHLVGQ
jgi:hypothetical protein